MNQIEIEVEISEDHYTILERMAEDEELTIEELVSRIIHEQLEEMEFEEDI